MTYRKSKQSPNYEKSDLGVFILNCLNENKRKSGRTNKPTTQKDLAIFADMSEAKLSRIINGKRAKGNSVTFSIDDYTRICVGLGLDKEKRKEFLYVVSPQLGYIDKHYENGCPNVFDLNDELSEHGIPPLETKSPE